MDIFETGLRVHEKIVAAKRMAKVTIEPLLDRVSDLAKESKMRLGEGSQEHAVEIMRAADAVIDLAAAQLEVTMDLRATGTQQWSLVSAANRGNVL